MHSHSALKSPPAIAESLTAPSQARSQRRFRNVSEPVVGGLTAAWDGVCVLVAGLVAVLCTSPEAGVDWRLTGLIVAVGATLAINLLNVAGAYRLETLRQVEKSFGQVLCGWLLTVGTLVAILHVTSTSSSATTAWLLTWSVAGLTLLSTNRLVLYHLTTKWSRAGKLTRRVAVVGAGPIGQRLLVHLSNQTGASRLEIVGIYDDRSERLPRRCFGYPLLGDVDNLVRDVREDLIDMVIVALPLSADWRLSEVMKKLITVPVDVRICPDLFGFQIGACSVTHLGAVSLLNVVDRPLRDWHWIIKAAEDRILAVLILFMISPVMALIALLIKLDSPGPVFFKQKRYGFNNELIDVFKFRTMYHHAQDANAEQLTKRNDPRVTRLGSFLRRTSLDELPQFINVLRGEMSIVGPRPHALAAKAGQILYQEAVQCYDARHRVKPGITGWAQVNGWRGETETVEQIQKRVEHDLYYIEHWSVALDLKIIVRTILGGFTGRQAY
ncbi:MAG TPA: undecaprenyl-phosphate glucose phosphotransferase [Candidatus Acidoferrales bacterium]|nr:undecaprenyl-phosphate glucose phosphotransferase [Candidatus Acidoferrales bacterium]